METNKNVSNPDIFSAVKKVFRTIGAGLATLIMVGVITGCLVASVLTVYVLQSIGAEDPINLDSAELGYTSIIIAYDKDGNEIELERLYDPENNRIPVEFSEINQYTKDAMVAIEDKRFYEHEGVDWIRTSGAFVNMFIPVLEGGGQGGSTIHQQLIKNITGDDEYRIDRKVKEIFRALNLAQNYTHDQVLEAYLNVVPFGAGTSGIQAAANVYFGKDAIDLTLAETASIVGITQKPTAYNPLLYPKENAKRQKMVLNSMLDQEKITQKEYDDALKEKLVFKENVTVETKFEPTSYFVDHVIESVIADLMELKGITRKEASQELLLGGYRIYTTVDTEIQSYLEDFYKDQDNFPPINLSRNSEYPESAAVIMDHNGKILALVGGRGTKTTSRSFNRATMAKRQPGSTLKPIGPYALAFEYNLITPSTIIEDSPINPEDPPSEHYPRNYYETYYGPVTVEHAIRRSINTVAVKVTQLVTPASLFDFLYYDLDMTSLIDPTDIDLAPMALGATTEGVTVLELTGAFQIIANGGMFTKPYAYTHVTDSNDRIVLKTDTTPRRVLSEDTSILLNKMIQEVVATGTGAHAKISNMPTAGKTGTSNDNVDQWFVGMTPYYLANVWLGYDKPYTFDKYGNKIQNQVLYLPHPYPTPPLWKSIMEPLHKDLPYEDFLASSEVIQSSYCVYTGDSPGPNCSERATTWYKASNLPRVCNGVHITAEEDSEDDEAIVDENGVVIGGESLDTPGMDQPDVPSSADKSTSKSAPKPSTGELDGDINLSD